MSETAKLVELEPGTVKAVKKDHYLWAYEDRVGTINITSRGGAATGDIFWAITEIFETEFFSEHDPEYWGFDTQEEMELAFRKTEEKYETKLHAEIIKYVKGEPNDLRSDTNGVTLANIAKDLIAENPSLLSSDKKAELMAATYQVYRADYFVTVTLDDVDISRRN